MFGDRAGLDRTTGLPDGLHVALCGTGSPLPDPGRAGACTVIIAGKHIFVVDSGRRRRAQHLIDGHSRMAGSRRVFLTHFHSDHIDGLGPDDAAALDRLRRDQPPADLWAARRRSSVVAGFDAAYALDAGYRTAHHGPVIAPPSGAGGVAMPFAIPPRGSTDRVVVYDKDGLRVTAFRVDHGPVDPAVGYRFDYKGRSVVVSGDTDRYAPALVRGGAQRRPAGP